MIHKNVFWSYLFSSLILAGYFFFFSFSKAVAVAPIINTNLTSVTVDNDFTVNASMSGLSDNTIYRMRIVFAQTGTSSYFGSTMNSSGQFYSGNPSPIDYSKFLNITTDGNGAWGGEIIGKIEGSDPNFPGIPGIYDFKIGRYTQSGTSATWSNTLSVQIIGPTPTFTPTPTEKPIPTSTLVPSSVPTSAPTFTSIPTHVPSRTIAQSKNLSVGLTSESSDTLGESTSESNLIIPTSASSTLGEETEVLGTSENNLPKIFIGLGIIFLTACGILLFRQRLKNFIMRKKENNQ